MKLAVGMIIWGNGQDWYPFVKTVREISKQDPRASGNQSLVVVLLLAEKRKRKIQKIIEILKSEVNDLLSNGYLQLVLSTFDLDQNHLAQVENKNINHVSSVTSLMNYRIAFLIKYSWEISDHVVLLDSEVLVKDSAMNRIFREMNNMRWNTLQIDLGSGNVMQKLYQGRYLPRVYGTFYAMAQLGIPTAIANSIVDSSVHAEKKVYKGEALVEEQHAPAFKNPPAKVTWKLQALGGKNAENVYLHKGPAWFTSPKRGDHLTVTFNDPAILTSIYIEAGLDSFKRDLFSHAVVELSYGKDSSSKECMEYTTISSFWQTSVVVISKDDKEAAVHLIKPVQCIRIRVTEDHRHWASLKTFIVQKE